MSDGKGFDPAWLTKLPVTGAVSGGPVASPDPGLASWAEGQAGLPRRLAEMKIGHAEIPCRLA